MTKTPIAHASTLDPAYARRQRDDLRPGESVETRGRAGLAHLPPWPDGRGDTPASRDSDRIVRRDDEPGLPSATTSGRLATSVQTPAPRTPSLPAGSVRAIPAPGSHPRTRPVDARQDDAGRAAVSGHSSASSQSWRNVTACRPPAASGRRRTGRGRADRSPPGSSRRAGPSVDLLVRHQPADEHDERLARTRGSGANRSVSTPP